MTPLNPDNYTGAHHNVRGASVIVDALVNHGIVYFCISPGSRSTPLTLAAAQHPSTSTFICYDERAAAFHALGHARATGNAAALICTSGTAVANYLPAVVEASIDGVPMVILSADRPFELRECGANQTIRQPGIFGSYVNYQLDLPVMQADVSDQYLRGIVETAVTRGRQQASAPVHLNCPFREPLAPAAEDCLQIFKSVFGDPGAVPAAPGNMPESFGERQDIEQLAERIAVAREGIILCGRMPATINAAESLEALSDHLNWPVFADIGSGLRLRAHAGIIHHYDQLLLSERIQQRIAHLPVLQFGREPVSKRWLQFRKEYRPDWHAVVLPGQQRIDPLHQVDLRINAGIHETARQLLDSLTIKPDQTLRTECQAISARVTATIKSFVSERPKLNEISVAYGLSTALTNDDLLFLGSSMPVRDMDMFAVAGSAATVAANRGASGIDGTIATACGLANGFARRVHIILGDLSALHDLNSLHQVAASPQPLTIIIVNNGGGGIFSFLPIHQQSAIFEDFFGTPHQMSFEAAAEMFGIAYARAATIPELAEQLAKAGKTGASRIIEVTTDRANNLLMHKELQSIMTAIVDKK